MRAFSLLLWVGVGVGLVSAGAFVKDMSRSLNDWPIIGVFAQPSTSTEGNCKGNCQYIAASYVKYLEAAGARVVPIDYYSTNSEIDHLVENLNGFFFPGGGSAYPSSAKYLYSKIIQSNDNHDFLPLWGTCMGFQWLLISQSGNPNILDPSSGVMDSYNYSIPLNFTEAASGSRLYGSAPEVVNEILATKNVTMNNHHYGIYPAHFAATESLVSFFNVLSTNRDRQGLEFVSSMEAYKYPIYGTQWHPEKNTFEWGKTNGIPNEAINHSPEAILIAQYTADFFVQQARQNTHQYADPNEEDAALINNYNVYKTTGSFMETYFFHF